MRKSMFAAVVLVATLPSLALAGEPVPMTDGDLDSVAAGLSLRELRTLSAEQILADPGYAGLSGQAVARYNALSSSQKLLVQNEVRARILGAELSSSDHAKLRAITPEALRHLLPTQ